MFRSDIAFRHETDRKRTSEPASARSRIRKNLRHAENPPRIGQRPCDAGPFILGFIAAFRISDLPPLTLSGFANDEGNI
jgi:hypothetical protein